MTGSVHSKEEEMEAGSLCQARPRSESMSRGLHVSTRASALKNSAHQIGSRDKGGKEEGDDEVT